MVSRHESEEAQWTKVREALRQAERMLVVQTEARESALRRTGELLRLAVATIGAIVVVAGILTTTRYPIDVLAGGVALAGTSTLCGSVVQFTRVLAGAAPYGLVAYGPDLPRVLDAARDPMLDEVKFLGSLVESAAEWIADNGASLLRIQEAKGRALNLYIGGAILLLSSAVYIAGGAIHG